MYRVWGILGWPEAILRNFAKSWRRQRFPLPEASSSGEEASGRLPLVLHRQYASSTFDESLSIAKAARTAVDVPARGKIET
eukprot:192497-Pyramimonas_sp.AAC.1